MQPAILDQAVDFFTPHLNPGCVVNFTGGEPILAFPLIERAVKRLAGQGVSFALATNGSLITPRIADFLDQHRFVVLLSWDGPLQPRQRGAPHRVAQAMRLLRSRQGIRLESNTVVTPESVHLLEPALREIHAAGINALHVNPDRSACWTQPALDELAEQLRLAAGLGSGSATRSHRPALPLVSLPVQPRKAPLLCTAGQDRLAISPRGEVWGCHRFVDYFEFGGPHVQRRHYAFGALDLFMAGFPDTYLGKLPAYLRLRPEFYSGEHGLCLNCPDRQLCGVCPVPFGSGVIGEIPVSACRIQALLRPIIRPSCD